MPTPTHQHASEAEESEVVHKCAGQGPNREQPRAGEQKSSSAEAPDQHRAKTSADEHAEREERADVASGLLRHPEVGLQKGRDGDAIAGEVISLERGKAGGDKEQRTLAQ